MPIHAHAMPPDIHTLLTHLPPPCLPACLPAGGYGPKLESWAFGVDQDGLEALLREGVFQLRTCKLCDEGVVVKGEYGLTNSLMKYGYNVDTLMSMYRGVSGSYKRILAAALWLAGWLPACSTGVLIHVCAGALQLPPLPHACPPPTHLPACRWTGGTGGTGGATTTCTPRGTAPMEGSPCTPLKQSSSRHRGTWGSRLWTNTRLGCWPRWVLGEPTEWWVGGCWAVVARSFCRRSAIAASAGQRSSAPNAPHPLVCHYQFNATPACNAPPCHPSLVLVLQAAGRDTTAGSFDEAMYRYAISPEAQESHNVEQCYKVLH
jgi:hypothetical protein